MTIDVEARRLTKNIANVDKHRKRYLSKTSDYVVKFVSPKIYTYDKYRFYLLRNSERRVLDTKYYYRPDYLSFDEYDTTLFWQMLLYINDVPNIESFNKDTILVPTFSSVLEISFDGDLSKDLIDIDLLNKTPSNKKLIELYTSKIKPNLESTSNEVSTTETEVPSYIRQKFTLKEIDIQNKYIDLAFRPVEESINLKIVGQLVAPVYDVHYTITKNTSDDLLRLSWKSTDNYDGDGMEDILEAGIKLEVQYHKDV